MVGIEKLKGVIGFEQESAFELSKKLATPSATF
jgi:hypothetical protein